MRWRDMGIGTQVLIVVLGLWWVFGAWATSALGFRDPWVIVGMPFALGFVFVAMLQGLIKVLRRLER